MRIGARVQLERVMCVADSVARMRTSCTLADYWRRPPDIPTELSGPVTNCTDVNWTPTSPADWFARWPARTCARLADAADQMIQSFCLLLLVVVVVVVVARACVTRKRPSNRICWRLWGAREQMRVIGAQMMMMVMVARGASEESPRSATTTVMKTNGLFALGWLPM